MYKFLQKLGKSLMLPVAALPICGILMGLGYVNSMLTHLRGNEKSFQSRAKKISIFTNLSYGKARESEYFGYWYSF